MAISEQVKNIRYAQLLRFDILEEKNHHQSFHDTDSDEDVADEEGVKIKIDKRKNIQLNPPNRHRLACGVTIRKFAKLILNHWIFQRLTVATFLGTFLVFFDTYYDDSFDSEDIIVKSYLFIPIALLSIFEITLKLIVDFKGFWKNYVNIFDVMVVIVALSTSLTLLMRGTGASTQPNVIRHLRMSRMLLVSLRPILHVKGSRFLVGLIFKTLKAMKDILGLLLVVSFIFASMGVYLFMNSKPSSDESIEDLHFEHKKNDTSFGNLLHSSGTMFQLMTFDHWYRLLVKIWNTDHIHDIVPSIFIICWIIFGGFVFVAIFTGTLENIIEQMKREDMKKNDDTDMRKEDEPETDDALASKLRSPHDKSQGLQGSASLEMKLKAHAWKVHVQEKLKLYEEDNITTWPSDFLLQFYNILEVQQQDLENVKELQKLTS